MDTTEWSIETITLLDRIRLNSIVFNKYYKKRHLLMHEKIKWFKIPLICLNGISATASVGLANYDVDQKVISAIICLIGLTNGIITSTELFLQIEKQAEKSILLCKEFYILACDIFKIIHLNERDRGVDCNKFLDETYSRYIELIRGNGVMEKEISDQLLELSCGNIPLNNQMPISPMKSPNSIISTKSFKSNDSSYDAIDALHHQL